MALGLLPTKAHVNAPGEEDNADELEDEYQEGRHYVLVDGTTIEQDAFRRALNSVSPELQPSPGQPSLSYPTFSTLLQTHHLAHEKIFTMVDVDSVITTSARGQGYRVQQFTVLFNFAELLKWLTDDVALSLHALRIVTEYRVARRERQRLREKRAKRHRKMPPKL
ncbi:hypothetical protein BOTBODRAFT_55428 [Botryobasidium botryosum FD-172 SS1]|uniref:Uncharacterized protein n=1 Tax=Botryobasidium botryosum (strain FD-172 SS1) TaxID=930990 RepID=A0A067MSL9_BOTB1|nr:hypothetical protein BOTBODRAFT_55428 [Botryobasidium botryosum FD-172 SS1]